MSKTVKLEEQRMNKILCLGLHSHCVCPFACEPIDRLVRNCILAIVVPDDKLTEYAWQNKLVFGWEKRHAAPLTESFQFQMQSTLEMGWNCGWFVASTIHWLCLPHFIFSSEAPFAKLIQFNVVFGIVAQQTGGQVERARVHMITILHVYRRHDCHGVARQMHFSRTTATVLKVW